MKATIDIPDHLYRQVKAKSALEGRAIREVAKELFQDYVEGRAPGPQSISAAPEAASKPAGGLPAWFGIARQYLAVDAGHEWSEIEERIERGWATESAPPAPGSGAPRRR